VDESRTVGSGEVRDAKITRQPANETVRLLRSRDGHLRGWCPYELIRDFTRLTGRVLGSMWTPPLRRNRVGYSGH